MAVKNLPTIRTVLSGDNITSFDQSLTFTLAEKLENTYSIISTDSPITIDISKINNIKSIIFNSTAAYTVTLSIDIGTTETPNVVVVPFSITDTFRLDASSALISKISSIQLSTISTTAIYVSVFIYGAQVTV